ncbi:MAG: NAD-dependent deacylase [Chloroflexota bacterium]|nr:NAD-dependent deacylase [Chloroflexota bacterium]
MDELVIPPALIQSLRAASRVAVLTGAGISAESGIPTFRDAQSGLWARYRPEELATPGAFKRDPRLVWEWYEWRRNLVTDAKPNLGHRSLVIMEKQVPDFTLITQNVDGLHQLAGSKNVIELHGNIHRSKCSNEGTFFDQPELFEGKPPLCPDCGAYLRPDVVWFSESLPPEALHTTWESAQNCDLFLSIGTSALVEPAASLPLLALENGATVAEINIQETQLTPYARYFIAGPAAQVMPEIVKITWQVDMSAE